MKKAFKLFGGILLIMVIVIGLFFLAALPGILIVPQSWIALCFCMVLFMAIYSAGIYGMIYLLSKLK